MSKLSLIGFWALVSISLYKYRCGYTKKYEEEINV